MGDPDSAAPERTAPEMAYGPQGDPARHRTWSEICAAVQALPALDPRCGRLAHIFRRCPDGSRETPGRVELTPERGLPGDRWERTRRAAPDEQLTLIRLDVASILANGQSLELFGDNLVVEFDLSAANVPAGTRLRLGEALLEVTPEPHDGCGKFRARFGADALRFVQARETRDHNYRGIYCKVVSPGEIAVGDRIARLGAQTLPSDLHSAG